MEIQKMSKPGFIRRFMRLRREAGQKGFTLLEVLVVSSIIGILAAIAIPSLAGSRKSAYQSACLHALRAITDAEEMFFRDNTRYTDNWSELDNYLPRAYSGYRGKFFFVENYSLYFEANSNYQRYTCFAFPIETGLRLGTFLVTDEGIPETPKEDGSWEPA
jgi:prepilin-type N-terminal cleavage/methylation domain-containing protein